MTQRLFKVLIFSKNQEKVDILLRNFWKEEWYRILKSEEYDVYQGEHFEITHYKTCPSDTFRGHKADLVYVDRDLAIDDYEKYSHYLEITAPFSNLNIQRFPIEPQLF